MQGQATKTQLHQYQDQRAKKTGQGNCSQRSQIPNKPRNQVLAQKEATPQPTTVPRSSGMCTPI
jgi:hypothetical protein